MRAQDGSLAVEKKLVPEASENFYLRLDDATLIFFPHMDGNDSGGIVVQVLMVLAQSHPDISTVEMALEFYAVQREVTDVVNAILYGHIVSGLPEQVTYEGFGFVLHGSRKEWKYGQRLQFSWGESEVQPCKDKWVFTFEVA
ncbi:uncharacterized protein SCHCODRAFT_02636799 [Schizophyllum commune H4-8]|uniref:uncharacterized protein n=1 Tax=Schizophyllum commune (strain H4-8 / FGSC 9210) TaxID=578458 RepID=UPI002160C6A7|nr:uncharacterized protein SCHCODRAFT_02636799 [Schizophyllum commune H4-8]KAI5888468.1 hypothetical protein SCHCODRAFT_02636799 [Schizophyllum commune H4-8]